MRYIDFIVIHCTATKEGQNVTKESIDRYHRSLGWKCIGYHYMIYLNGQVVKGREEEEVGAHAAGCNRQSIGIAYVGGCDLSGKAKDTRTEEQKKALHKLVKELLAKYPGAKVVGHRDLSPDKNGNGVIEPNEWVKQCPCFNVKDEF